MGSFNGTWASEGNIQWTDKDGNLVSQKLELKKIDK